ncbi:MAG: hypothetical protein AB3N33_06845 [Puniceicoccaceae bacterium]
MANSSELSKHKGLSRWLHNQPAIHACHALLMNTGAGQGDLDKKTGALHG